MPYSKQSQANCWVWTFKFTLTTDRILSYFCISPSRSLINRTIQLSYTNYLQTWIVFSLAWVLLRLGPPDQRAEGSSGCESSPSIPDSSGLSQHTCPRTCLYPPEAPFAAVFLLCLRYTQLLSERISRRKPYDLLIRFPKDSVKLKPGARNSHKHQGTQEPKFGLSLRTSSSFFFFFCNHSLIWAEETCLQQKTALSTRT